MNPENPIGSLKHLAGSRTLGPDSPGPSHVAVRI